MVEENRPPMARRDTDEGRDRPVPRVWLPLRADHPLLIFWNLESAIWNFHLRESASSADDSLLRDDPAPSAVLVAQPPREGMHLIHVLVRHALDQLRRRRIIRHRPDEADRGIRLELAERDELIEPAIGEHSVVVQQDEVSPPRDLQALVD